MEAVLVCQTIVHFFKNLNGKRMGNLSERLFVPFLKTSYEKRITFFWKHTGISNIKIIFIYKFI